MKFSDYWPLALAVQLMTTALIGAAAWMNSQTCQHRKALTQEIAELRQKVDAEKELTAKQTMLPLPKEPTQPPQ